MKRFNEQFRKRADALKLSAEEKRDLKSRVVSYMEYHPITTPHNKNARRFTNVQNAKNPLAFLRSFYTQSIVGMCAVLFVVVSIPVIAEQAMPGEVLYPVKVRFNEEVQGTFARSPYEKVAWETERLERRLAEARILENNGQLTPQVEADVAEAVKQHSEAVQLSIASIREQDSDAAAIAEITLSSALEIQSEMLEGRSVALNGAVDAARQVVAASRERSRPSYERLLARIELESTSAYELFDAVKDETSHEDKEDINERLERIERASAEAEELKDTDPDKAVTVLSEVLTDTRKVISFMTDIHVRENVSLDELIPVDLSPEETEAFVRARINEVEEMESTIISRIEHVDINTRTAIEDRLAAMSSELDTASSSIAAGDIEAADVASLAALTIAHEITGVLDQYDIEIGNTSTSTSTTTNDTTSSTTSNTATTSSETDPAADSSS